MIKHLQYLLRRRWTWITFLLLQLQTTQLTVNGQFANCFQLDTRISPITHFSRNDDSTFTHNVKLFKQEYHASNIVSCINESLINVYFPFIIKVPQGLLSEEISFLNHMNKIKYFILQIVFNSMISNISVYIDDRIFMNQFIDFLVRMKLF